MTMRKTRIGALQNQELACKARRIRQILPYPYHSSVIFQTLQRRSALLTMLEVPSWSIGGTDESCKLFIRLRTGNIGARSP